MCHYVCGYVSAMCVSHSRYVLVFIPVLMVGGVITLLLVGSVCGSVGAICRKTASSPSYTKCGAVGLLV